MVSDELDLDALLEGHGSDDDDANLPDLGRTIDDILNDAELGDDVSFPSLLLEKDEAKQGNHSSDKPFEKGGGIQRDAAFEVHEKEGEGSQAGILGEGEGVVAYENPGSEVCESGEIMVDEVKEDVKVGVAEQEQEEGSYGRLPPLKSKNQRIWEFNSSKASHFNKFSPFHVRHSEFAHPFDGSRAIPRPGAALAAATAASRRLDSPVINSMHLLSPSALHPNVLEESSNNSSIATDAYLPGQKVEQNESKENPSSVQFNVSTLDPGESIQSLEDFDLLGSISMPHGSIGSNESPRASADELSNYPPLPLLRQIGMTEIARGEIVISSTPTLWDDGSSVQEMLQKDNIDNWYSSVDGLSIFQSGKKVDVEADAIFGKSGDTMTFSAIQSDKGANEITFAHVDHATSQPYYEGSNVFHNSETARFSSADDMQQSHQYREAHSGASAHDPLEVNSNIQATKSGRVVEGKDEDQEHYSQGSRALQLAEQLEKTSANRGLHWKEGAVAQPLRLEGMDRGPPAIGLLQVDQVGPISFALSSTTMRREHGVAQSLSVHANFIAVGMSKGTVLVTPSKYSANRASDETDSKAFFLGNVPEKPNAVTSICFSPQGDMLLAGYTNGALTLWDVARATIVKAITDEHGIAVVHTVFLEHDLSVARHLRAISADSKGLVLLHTFTAVPLFRRFSVTTQCLLDGRRTGVVLSLSALLYDENSCSFDGLSPLNSGGTAPMPTGLSGVMGGMVGGVVAGVNNDVGRKFLYDGSSSSETGGAVVLVTNQIALVIRLTPGLEICAKLSRPDGIPERSIPYTAWRRSHRQTVSSNGGTGSGTPCGSVNASNESLKYAITTVHDPQGFLLSGSINDAEDSDRLPLLAFAWDKKIFITQLVRNELKIMVKWDIPAKAAGIAWLGEQVLVVLTVNEELHLYTKEGCELEQGNLFREEIDDEKVVHHTHFLNSFGNPEKDFHNVIAVRGAALYLLGTLNLWRARLLPWKDRIKALQDAGDWMGAFHIAMELYDGKAKGVTGLPKRLDALREAIAPSLLELLSSYIDEAFTYLSLAFGSSSGAALHNDSGVFSDPLTSSSRVEIQDSDVEFDLSLVVKEQYARVGGVAIEFCVHIKRTDVLFGNVFEKFSAVGQKGAFLELLEPYILKDMLGQLAPEVMQALVEHYSSKGWLQRVEQFVLHMDIASLDFNQVVKLCRGHGLYSALIYLFQQGLDDFKSPLEELLVVAQDIHRPNAQAFGYKSLVYLKYCFLGLAFPPGEGDLPPERVPLLRSELLELVLSPDGKAVLGSDNVQGSAYPILSYLLRLDTVATLHVLYLASSKHRRMRAPWEDEVIESSVIRFLQRDSCYGEGFDSHEVSMVQLMVDALVHILATCSCSSSTLNQLEETITPAILEKQWPSASDTSHIYEFLAHFVSLKGLIVPKTTLSQILRYLAFGVDDTALRVPLKKSKSLRRRERLMMNLLVAVPDTEWDAEIILKHAYEVEFWQVVALLSSRRADYRAALKSLIRDSEQPQQAFKFIQKMLSPETVFTENVIRDFKETVLEQIPDLVSLSSEATLLVVLQHFVHDRGHVIKMLEPHPKLLFQYLKAVMNFHSGLCEDGTCFSLMGPLSSDTHSSSGGVAFSNHKESTALEKKSSLAELLRQSGMEITTELTELYIQLMCQFEPQSALKFLQSCENYRLERCLKLCQRYGVTDGAIFLFERVGDIGSALDLLLADLVVLISELDKAIVSFSRPNPHLLAKSRDLRHISEVTALYSVMESSVGLCQRNNLRLDQQESESLWFALLDRFMEPLQDLLSQKEEIAHGTEVSALSLPLKKTKYTWKVLEVNCGFDQLRGILVNLVSSIVDGMMGHVPLRIIMTKVLENHGGHEFQDFKRMILGMLHSFSYELALLGTAKSLIEDDAFQSILSLKRRRTHAYVPTSSQCCVCSCNFTQNIPIQSKTGLFENGADNDVVQLKESVKAAENGSYSAIQIFFCGHAAHVACLKCAADNSKSKKGKSKLLAVCPICPYNIKVTMFLHSEAAFTDSPQKSNMVQLWEKSSNAHGKRINNADVDCAPSRFELLKSLQKGNVVLSKSPLIKTNRPSTSQSMDNKTTHKFNDSSSDYAHSSSSYGGSDKLKSERSWSLHWKAKVPSMFQFPSASGV